MDIRRRGRNIVSMWSPDMNISGCYVRRDDIMTAVVVPLHIK